jgi:ring-1,2-phenylacetyl-CoA epoxidase subunit PaaB
VLHSIFAQKFIIHYFIMPIITSLDPRITRLGIPEHFDTPPSAKEELDQFQTYEIFCREKTGAHHVHVGSVHAPSPEIALSFAKEQYGRRGKVLNMWVVKTADVYVMDEQDADMFETAGEKGYRDVVDYARVRDRIDAFKQKQQTILE